jgi:general stress protein 26
MSRRAQIAMTPEEVRAYLAGQRVINVATMGGNGRPHVAPLFYVPHGEVAGAVATWTYASSQKAVNLRREPRATVLVESGETYDQLRGVTMETDVEILTDVERVLAIGTAMSDRYDLTGGASGPEVEGFLRAQAGKRVGLVFTPTKIVSWDHAKLGGTY